MICRDDLDYFLTDISKDVVSHGLAQCGNAQVFRKRTPSPAHARREHDTLLRLHASPGETLAPEPLGTDDRDVLMRLTDGIRLFELLVMLREIALSHPALAGAAREARDRLLARCLAREQRIRTLLLTAPDVTRTPYPFDRKVRHLVGHLARLCGLPPAGDALSREMDLLEGLWTDAVCVPFRDATPKNILVAEAGLAIRAGSPPALRRARLIDRLRTGDPDHWDRVAILDIDFTSVEHLTTPEDDAISLLGHQASHEGPAAATLDALCRQAPERAALGLLVRYLRFGGRKLSYRILNPTGFRVRFRHDAAAYYLLALPERLARLSPSLAERIPVTLARCRMIGAVAARLGPPAPDEPDPYLLWSDQPARYWQESPLEGHAP